MGTGGEHGRDEVAERAGADSNGLDALLPLVHDALHALAHSHLRGERRGHTLQTTELVSLAYLRLRKDRIAVPQNRAHFMSLASMAIRRILVEHARSRMRRKRGGRGHDRLRVTLGCAEEAVNGGGTIDLLELIALDEALNDLAGRHERAARVVEMRFFGDMSHPAIAEVLGVSLRTVEGDWKFARSWLCVRLRGDDADVASSEGPSCRNGEPPSRSGIGGRPDG